MAHQVVWTKKVTEFFEEAGNLTKFECEVLETRISGMSIKEQAYYFSCSEGTINKCISKLKRKYDAVQAEYPDELRPRRSSAAETYLDEH